LNEELGIYERLAGDSEGTRSHTCSFSSVSRLREAVSASRAFGASGGGVVLLKVERRGELSEEETRGLTADRAVPPLVIELECMDELRRGGGFWSADDILWDTLGGLVAVVVLASVARHVYSTPIMMDSEQIQSESLDQVKISLITCKPTHSPYL
jgi:hypothetical protein